jgi:hypothetical protein
MFNYSGRLFTFGCSFTRYQWPTWADILGRKFSYYENWGSQGSGNQYILNSVIESNQRNKFTPNDTVIIMWTTVARADYYTNSAWVGGGDVYVNTHRYSKEYIVNFADPRGFLIKDLAAITIVKELLELKQIPYHFLSVMPYDLESDLNVKELYAPALTAIKPSVFEVVFNSTWPVDPFKPVFRPLTTSQTNSVNQKIIKLYNELRGDDWPTTDDYISGTYTIENSKVKEELELFAAEAKGIKHQSWAYLTSFTPFKKERDTHPYPHEHLDYLIKTFPNWEVDEETRNWVLGDQSGWMPSPLPIRL